MNGNLALSSAAQPAPRLAIVPRSILTVEGEDLDEIQRYDRIYEAMWQQLQASSDNDANADAQYNKAARSLALKLHLMLKRVGDPVVTPADECACGNTKRVDASMCVECSDLYGMAPRVARRVS